VRVRAFAKINPTLAVLGRRDDGYHDLRVTFQSLTLHDTLVFERIDGPLRIVCDDPSIPEGRSNLVWRAAEQVWRAAGQSGDPRGVRVRLDKRIPARAGLGGGSSDAAAALRALNVLWDARLARASLHELGASLGADVAYFLQGGTAIGLDRGDRLSPLPDWPETWVALLVPSVGVSTADAYGWLDRDRRAGHRRSRSRAPRRARRWALPGVDPGNDLQGPVGRRHPEVVGLVRLLIERGAAVAAMSGSGSAVFGLFRSRAKAEVAAMAVAEPSCPAIVTRTITRREYAARSRPLRLGRSPV
jgi:4-diphosphocytidyl-2-C-methyl-D-erythritol kinase